MDLLKKHLNKIIIGVVVLIIIVFVYNRFFNSDESDFAESGEIVVAGNEVDEISQRILQTLDKLNRIDIDVNFFSEDLSGGGGSLLSFYDLVDFSATDITPKNIGKQNPFSADSEFYNQVYGGPDEAEIIEEDTETTETTETETDLESPPAGE